MQPCGTPICYEGPDTKNFGNINVSVRGGFNSTQYGSCESLVNRRHTVAIERG